MDKYLLPEQASELAPEQVDHCYSTLHEELSALDTVIDAAESGRRGDGFVFEAEQRRRGYDELYRHGFGKSVIIESEKVGRMTYRVSQATCDYANTHLGFASPDSPVGRLCRMANVGMQLESPMWGRYTVVEVRNFARFSGREAAEHIKNFRVMESSIVVKKTSPSFNIQTLVQNLRASLLNWFGPASKKEKTKSAEITSQINHDIPLSAKASENTLTEDSHWFEDEVSDTPEYVDIESENIGRFDIHNRSDEDRNEYYGLSNYFYLNPTPEQMSIMSNDTSAGPMFVEGVAGSGKTCAALGRAKRLCDLGRTTDKEQFNPDFIAESSVGFVRTGELVQYLRASCLELGIEQLPIEEYASLAYRLSEVRELLQGRAQHSRESGKYVNTLATAGLNEINETSMAWLHAVDRVIARLLSERLLQHLNQLAIPERLLNKGFLTEPTVCKALEKLLHSKLKDLYQPILNQLHGETSQPFCLEGIIAQILRAHDTLDKSYFAEGVKWINPAADIWVNVYNSEQALDKLREFGAVFALIDRKHHPQTNRLISVVSTLFIQTRDDLVNLFNLGGVISSQKTEKTFKPEDIDTLWDQKGLNQLQIQFAGKNPLGITWLDNADDLLFNIARDQLRVYHPTKLASIFVPNPFRVAVGDGKTSLGSAFKQQLKTFATHWFYADFYRVALEQDAKEWKKLNIWSASKRIAERRLSSHDKDLLLCIAHIMSKGVANTASVPSRFHEQIPYRSVFIDEVQDFTEQQVFLMAEQADPKYHAVTLVGDMQQQLGKGHVTNLDTCFPYRPLQKYLLKENKRQEKQPQLAATAMLFRALVQGDERINQPESVSQWRKDANRGTSKRFHGLSFESLDYSLLNIISEQPHGRTIAVVCPNHEMAVELESRLKHALVEQTPRTSRVSESIDLAKKYEVHFSGAENVKGLEFDTLIFAGLERIDWSDKHQRNKVYVSLSRPRKFLAVFGAASQLPNNVAACMIAGA